MRYLDWLAGAFFLFCALLLLGQGSWYSCVGVYGVLFTAVFVYWSQK